MRLLIVGLGVMGTGYGWALAEAGHQASHLLRPIKAAARPGCGALSPPATSARTVRR